MIRPRGLRTWIEVSRPALKQNYLTFRKILKPTTQMMAVVKSNAYGHNFLEFSRNLEEFGVDWFGVDSIVEALSLRRAGIRKPILVLGYTLPENLPAAARHKISLTVSNFDHLKALKTIQSDTSPKIHLKVDTGLHRQGFSVEELPTVVDFVRKNLPRRRLEGVYTHFAAAKDPRQTQLSRKQSQQFKQALEILKNQNLKPLRHAAATGAALIFPKFHYDLVRIGIGLYGHYPSAEIKKSFAAKLNLQPALSWKAIIGEINEVRKGERVGYDLTGRVRYDSRLAVCPVGYWHGYPRALSNLSRVLLHGQFCQIIGRISMDMIIVDVTKIPDVRINDEVILLGRQGNKEISAEELAELAATTNYEILTRLNPLIERIYI